MNLFLRSHLILLISLFMVSCVTIPKGITPVERTWLYGIHELPASATISGSTEAFNPTYKNLLGAEVAAKKLKPGIKIPVVIYLHGCGGIGKGDDAYIYQDLLLSQGYAFFMIDSFARPGRVKLCGKHGDDKFSSRALDVSYAVKRVRELSWVDQNRLVLLGFSEGAHVASMWATSDFSGIIMLGTECKHSGGSPVAPSEVPVLAITGGESDVWTRGWSCSVKRTVSGSRSIVIKDAPHNIAHYSEVQDAMKFFLKQCCE